MAPSPPVHSFFLLLFPLSSFLSGRPQGRAEAALLRPRSRKEYPQGEKVLESIETRDGTPVADPNHFRRPENTARGASRNDAFLCWVSGIANYPEQLLWPGEGPPETSFHIIPDGRIRPQGAGAGQPLPGISIFALFAGGGDPVQGADIETGEIFPCESPIHPFCQQTYFAGSALVSGRKPVDGL